MNIQNNKYNNIKPFVKWVGGKKQLLNDINNNLPDNINDIDTYIEPFIGGGAVLFDIVPKLPNIKHVIINDLNYKLINVYKVIKDNHNALIKELSKLQELYYDCETNNNNNNSDIEIMSLNTISSDDDLTVLEISNTKTNKETMYYEIRDSFNTVKNIYEYNKLTDGTKVKFAAEFIFLNKTCYNGLYRENKKGEFNSPWNKSKKPCICDKDNITNIHNFLNDYDVEILTGDYYSVFKFNSTYYRNKISKTKNKVLCYMDPPYRPITKSSAFTAYTKSGFNDDNQKELKLFCDILNNDNNYFIVSNSDPHNTDINDNFFDDLYKDYNIIRVNAKRNINSKGDKRGNITELLIKNF